jgi:hypothetical protein
MDDNQPSSGGTRSSPRLTKKKDSVDEMNNVQQENIQPTNPAVSTPNNKNSIPSEAGTTASKSKPESADKINARMEKELEQYKKSDKAKKKDDLLVILAGVRKDYWIAEHNVVVLTKQKDRFKKAQVETKAKLERAIHQLDRTHTEWKVVKEELKTVKSELIQAEHEKKQTRVELANALKQIKAMPKGGSNLGHMEKNKELQNLIKVKVDTILYGITKFIDDANDQIQAARLLVKFGGLPKEFVKTKEMQEQVAQTYANFIRKTLFLRRSYCTAEEKKYYDKKWKAGLPTLSLNDLIMCLKRDINSQEEMEKFMVYWEEILPNQVGKSQWNAQVRYYTTISNAVNEACTTHHLPLITPEHEAFTVLSIHNHLDRWRSLFEKGGEAEKEKDANNNGIYTSCVSGQNIYGGWSTEGMEKFNEYLNMNIEARADKVKAKVEKDCLRQLREKYNIEAENFQEHQKQVARRKSAKKRGKPELPMPPMKRKVTTMRYSADDSSEEEEEQEDGGENMGSDEE